MKRNKFVHKEVSVISDDGKITVTRVRDSDKSAYIFIRILNGRPGLEVRSISDDDAGVQITFSNGNGVIQPEIDYEKEISELAEMFFEVIKDKCEIEGCNNDIERKKSNS